MNETNELIKELMYENTDLKKQLKGSEDLRLSLVRTAAASLEHDHAISERLSLYEDVIVTARTLRDPETGTVNIENLLNFFEALDRIPVPS